MLLLTLLFLYDYIKKPYHILHAFWAYPAGTIAVILGKLTNTPSIVALQGGEGASLPTIRYGNMLHRFSRKATLWTCEKATALISISQFLTDKMYEHGLRRKDVILIPFGADLKTFKATSKTPDDTLKVIHVANLNLVKDQRTLLKAFALILKQQKAELRIVGDGVMAQNLRLYAQELGIVNHVTFVGALPNTTLPQQYQWADIMLHTSLYEGQAVVVGEALASNVVVCGTRVGIMADLSNICCTVSNVGDYNDIAKKTLALWRDTDAFATMRQQGYNWAIEHNMTWSASEVQSIYASIKKK
jgi:glycosyltransferase involved in cell wall biosynthesis